MAVGGLTYLATKLQSRTEHMLWRSQSRLDVFVQCLDLAGEVHNKALESLNILDENLPAAKALAQDGRQMCRDLLKLLLTLELHGPEYFSDQFTLHATRVMYLLHQLASLGPPVSEQTLASLVSRHNECGKRLRALRQEAREALDAPTRRRARWLPPLVPAAWRRLGR